jgi:outer membrane protein assembly factor BamA
MTPYFRDTLWRIGFDLNQTTSSLQANDYKIKTYGGSVFASYPFAPFWSYGVKYRIKDAIINISEPTPLEAQTATAQGYLSATQQTSRLTQTDSAYKPHRGFRSLLEAEFAGMLGQINFLRYGYLNSYYTPLLETRYYEIPI